jgi:hypothetical protein
VLSFLQMTVIPGFLVLSYSRITLESKLQSLLYTFALSLLINYLLVFSLTAAGIYKPIIIYVILSIEILLLLYYFSKHNQMVLNLKDYLTRFIKFWETKPFFYKLLFVLSIVMMGLFFYFFISRIKAVFYLNDPVLAWNRFTLDWYHNHFPVHTWRYPQLIPTNWSIAYIIMQNPDIQFIPRNIMAFFPIGATALFLDLALRTKKSTYLLALLFYGTIIVYLYRPAFIVGGYADIAVSFFAFLSFYALYSAKEDVFDLKRCLFSVVFASAAAVTKQIGFYILFYILAWNLWIIYKNKTMPGKKIIKVLLSMVLFTIIIVGPWYVYKEIQIAGGMEKSELSMLTQRQHGNRTTFGERFIYGFERIVNARGIPGVEFFIYGGLILLLLSLAHKQIRYITLFIVFPFTSMWVFLFSYDYRNLTLAFPFIALAMAYGFHLPAKKFIPRLGKKPAKPIMTETTPINHRLPRFRISILPLAVVITALSVLLNFTIFKKELIIKNQLTQLKNIGDIRLNKKLYRYYDENGFPGKVFSRYPYFKYLPVLRDYWAPERQESSVHYFLDTFNRPDKESVRQVKKKLKTGEYILLFKHNEYLFIKIK